MKKLVVISTFMTLSVGVMPVSYSAHPQSGTSKQQVVVTEAPAAVAKSPWSGKIKMDMEHTLQQKPRKALTNETTLDIGRVLFGDVKLSARAIWDNTFISTEGKQGSDRYMTALDPSVALSKGSLLEVAGINIGGELRSFIPATYASRADGVGRNPHLGFYHAQLVTAKEVGAWSFSTLHRLTHYNFQRGLNAEGKSNPRFRWLNEVAVAYKVHPLFSISSVVDFLTYETRKTSAEALPNTRLEWTSTIDAEPRKDLAISAGVTLTAPEQTLSRYSQPSEAGKTRGQTRLDNTKGVLSVSYSFL